MNKHTHGKALKNVDLNSKSTVKIINLPTKNVLHCGISRCLPFVFMVSVSTSAFINSAN